MRRFCTSLLLAATTLATPTLATPTLATPTLAQMPGESPSAPACVTEGAARQSADPEAQAGNRQIVTEAFNRWQAGGSTFFTDLLSPDVIWTIEGSGPSAGRYEGREPFIERAVRPFVARLSSPIRPVSKMIWADGDHVIVNWEGVGTAQDGQPYANSYAWILRMQGGKAVEVTAFLDLVPYDDVLRRIPAPRPE